MHVTWPEWEVFAIAVVFLIGAGVQFWIGKSLDNGGKVLTREDEPIGFWLRVMLSLVGGLLLFAEAVYLVVTQ